MHKLDDVGSGDPSADPEFALTGGARNALVAAQRYYSNVRTDFERQQAMDLILGVFEPKVGQRPIWELKSRPENLRAVADPQHDQTAGETWEADVDEEALRVGGGWYGWHAFRLFM